MQSLFKFENRISFKCLQYVQAREILMSFIGFGLDNIWCDFKYTTSYCYEDTNPIF